MNRKCFPIFCKNSFEKLSSYPYFFLPKIGGLRQSNTILLCILDGKSDLWEKGKDDRLLEERKKSEIKGRFQLDD